MHNLIPHFIYKQYQAGNYHGKEGAELLADIINRVFDLMINAVYERGGFITGFAGDAFTAVFLWNGD